MIILRSLALVAGITTLLVVPGLGVEAPSAQRGAYVFHAGGCEACHTDEKAGGRPLSGGPPLRTPFGTFYAPNITPDREHGIGRWTDAQFLRALREGISPDGNYYYPVFPFTSYTNATVRDLLDLKAYLATIPPDTRPNRTHEIAFPHSMRFTLMPWRLLNFTSGEWQATPGRGPAWNRGSYLVEALLHCGECHTPRDWLGGLDRSQWMAGGRIGTGDVIAPNLTPHAKGLAAWSEDDIAFSLEFGTTPNGEVFGNEMAEVVRGGTSHMTNEDRSAIAVYLKSLKPLPSAVIEKSN